MSNQSQRPTTDPVKQALSYAQLPPWNQGYHRSTIWTLGPLCGTPAGPSNTRDRCGFAAVIAGQDKLVLGTHMRLGISKSCGCGLRYEAIAKAVSTHGKSDSPEWGIWSNMKTRCYNPNGSGYASYGGRGIAMCERWRESFESFLSDMGPRPGPDYQLDRIDNNGNYEPGNCRWVTRSDNCRNRRSNRRLAFQGPNADRCRMVGCYGYFRERDPLSASSRMVH